MPGITYPYNLCGIKVPGYTTSSTEAEGETLLRYLVTRGVLSSNSNDSNLAFKKQTYKGLGVSCKNNQKICAQRRRVAVKNHRVSIDQD